MLLNDRKARILEAIINDYIAFAEPIGSRTIVKKYDLGISSATVRNEMSDLEDLGLIIQPHTSSGRIPSDKGYRLYVDSLMRTRELTDDEVALLRDIISRNISKIDFLMKETAHAVSALTNYTAIIGQEVASSKIKHIQLVPYDEKAIIAVVVTDTKAVKNIPVAVMKAPCVSALHTLSEKLNTCYAGLDVSDLTLTSRVTEGFGSAKEMALAVITAITAEFNDSENDYYTCGTNNFLGFPEFKNAAAAKEIFQALEEKQFLSDILPPMTETDIEIVICDENAVSRMKNCSLIRAGINVGGKKAGRLGIIGPTRMDYSQVASVLNGIVKRINTVLLELEEDR